MFEELSLHERLIKAIDSLGFTQPTDVQSAVLPLAFEGRDLMVSAETGSGKTLAFLLPILQRCVEQSAPRSGTRGLILTPTRELAEQVSATCEKLASFTRVNVLPVCGGENYQNQTAKIRKNPEIIVGTPGRIKEHIERNTIDFDDLEFLVLDEADRMLDMGFREEVLFVTDACRKERQSMLFSATLTHRGVGDILDRVLRDPETIQLSTAQTEIENIRQQVILADDAKLKEKQLAWLLKNESYDKAIVFTNTRALSDELGPRLQSQGLRVGVLHGELDQPQRTRILNLLRDGRINVLIATDVAARGLDIEGVDLVINFDLARSGDEHVHRVGRTGRAGREGLAICLIAPNEWNLKASIERYLKQTFEKRTIKGIEGGYTGPKKLKASGKAAGTGKKKESKKKPAEKPKVKKRLRDQKQVGKRRSKPTPISDDGFAPLKKKQ
ncbi:ATP-dependent RNA helicase SrmB [Marinobacterium lacunae]|uniref:ATP-dependent RNA helicase SrmB n=1 Tax=Marinobacterium lacunae TaxID=1232683 RepID=A0A081G1R2_9GAMM|nr:DEAD/DEAH box helicase [Marinobacterium lacunae]KEA64717.1 ATP-dependent RNA helicase SrmB [Marinobacterium lacunae]MBR9883928.1 DEAD/DEAH box helicase [Oceanospirillales bacterium]